MVQLKGLFKLAPSLAIKYFKNKNNKFSWDWFELWQDAHKKSFTVAKVMREDILKDIRSALDKALSEGKTFKEFSKELKPTLQKKGWWGEQIVVDSQGNAEKVQLGSMYRLKTIYSVNMQTACPLEREGIDFGSFDIHSEITGKEKRSVDKYKDATYLYYQVLPVTEPYHDDDDKTCNCLICR